jgi:hypothetical protein
MRCRASAAAFCFAAGCASAAPHAHLELVPASQPASAPASQPAMVTIPRADFDRLATMVIQHNADKNLALVDCTKNLTVKNAQDNAAQAKVDQQALALKVWAIAAPVIAAALTAAGAIGGHYIK